MGWRAGCFGFFFDAGEGGFDGVADEVDEELLDLVGVGEEIDVGGGEKADVETDFERDDALEQREQRDALEDGRGKLGELTVGLDESVERLGAVFDDGEAALQVALENGDGGRLWRGSWCGRGAGGGGGFRSVG